MTTQETVAAWEEERRVSKYADALEQLDTGRRISANPKDWKCDDTGATENLWLNLSTGHIGSGRRVGLFFAIVAVVVVVVVVAFSRRGPSSLHSHVRCASKPPTLSLIPPPPITHNRPPSLATPKKRNAKTNHASPSPTQNWDGSGGNGSALRHFEATGSKHPLVVKLGTITPSGADVYSYAPDEDDMVLDPHLDRHLRHWGINMMTVRC